MVHVLLGYLDEKKKRKNELRDKHKINKKFVSKIGGKPFWLDRINLPDEKEFNCSVCNNMMIFLLQIYAPLDELGNCFHRCLYVFICIHCGDQAKCFRTQLPRNNPFYNYYLQDSNYVDDPTNENDELIPSDDTYNQISESDDTDNDMSDSEENIKNPTYTNNNNNNINININSINNNNNMININIDETNRNDDVNNGEHIDMNTNIIISNNENFNASETINSNSNSNSNINSNSNSNINSNSNSNSNINSNSNSNSNINSNSNNNCFEPTGNNLNESDDTTNQINESDHSTNPFNESDDTNNEHKTLEKKEKEINPYRNNNDNKKDNDVNNFIMNIKEDDENQEKKKEKNVNVICSKRLENDNCNNKILTQNMEKNNNFSVNADVKKKDTGSGTDYYMTLIKKDKNVFDKSVEYYFCCNICGIPCVNKFKKHKSCKLKKHIIFQEHKIYISDEDDCESSSTGSEMNNYDITTNNYDNTTNNYDITTNNDDNTRNNYDNTTNNYDITTNNDDNTTNNISPDHGNETYESGETNKMDNLDNMDNNMKGNNTMNHVNGMCDVNNINVNNNNIHVIDYNKTDFYSNTNYSFNGKEQNKDDAEEIDLDISEMKAFEQIQRDIEHTRNIDKVFKNYIKKIQRFPSQFIRYSYNGTALYSSCDIFNSNRNNVSELPNTNNKSPNNMNNIYNTFNTNKVPRCHICKRRKVFEFQVLSTIFNFLKINKNIQVDNNIALNSKFAYLAIYTCENNCDIFDINNFKESQRSQPKNRYFQEYVYVQVEN
ncbi:programmed cell death 2 [Plasmodium falciparum IGH-CR14]|uniref:Programmed cell death 2 n=1 Tax=Plasmodium falciparum IGH-CR14 TaxID=580059 RepID=A0A0L1I462_PLAFA|nr:programmed cell death 2 [Plasmodium falciparum IGH-CR14]